MKDFLTGLPWVLGGIAAACAAGYGIYLLYGVIGDAAVLIFPVVMIIALFVALTTSIGHEINYGKRIKGKTSPVPPRGGSGASDTRETGQTR